MPDAAVHDWRGTVLVPGARLEDVVSRLEREPPDTRQEDVLSSSVLELRPGWMKVAVRVHRKLILSAVFDTEHEVTFERHGASRASSWSRATKIVEIADAGTPKERPKGEKEDRDLLWKWHAYWRYEQAGRGVVVECESITLSRPVPMLLKPIAGPLVNKVARESMERSLIALRERFKAPAPPPAPKAAAALPARRRPRSDVRRIEVYDWPRPSQTPDDAQGGPWPPLLPRRYLIPARWSPTPNSGPTSRSRSSRPSASRRRTCWSGCSRSSPTCGRERASARCC